MNAFNRYLCCTLLLVLSLLSCGETIESTWKNEPITVDGDGRDWKSYPLQYNEDMNLVYGFANNDRLLYCMIRFNDQHLARMMAVRGFTLWVNNEDSEKKLLGIHYQDRYGSEDFAQMSDAGRRQPDQQSAPSQNIIPPKGRFTIARHDTISELEVKDSYGLNASAGLDGGLYCFEFSIALKADTSLSHFLNSAAGNTIKVGMEVAGIGEEEQEKMIKQKAEPRASMGDGMHGGRPGERGGMSGERSSGGRYGGGPHMPDFDGEEIWMNIKLANH